MRDKMALKRALVVAAVILLLTVGGVAWAATRDTNIGNALERGILYVWDGSSNKWGITTQAMSANYTATLPTDDGLAKDVLVSDGSGTLSFAPRERQLAANITASTVAGNAAATAYTFTGDGSATVAGGTFRVGSVLHIRAGGTVTTDGSESETLQHTLKIGSKTLYASPATSFTTASTAVPWVIDGYLTILTTGASGTARFSGTYSTDPGAAGSSVNEAIGASVTSFDTTADQLVAVTATWANGDATPDAATMNDLVLQINDYD